MGGIAERVKMRSSLGRTVGLIRHIGVSSKLSSQAPSGADLQKAFLKAVGGEPFPANAAKSTDTVPPETPTNKHTSTNAGHKHSAPKKENKVHIHTEELLQFAPKILVIGVGGGGCNAVNNMISRGLTGVRFVCANTDAQHLASSLAETRLQLGKTVTQGLGCGANPSVG